MLFRIHAYAGYYSVLYMHIMALVSRPRHQVTLASNRLNGHDPVIDRLREREAIHIPHDTMRYSLVAAQEPTLRSEVDWKPGSGLYMSLVPLSTDGRGKMVVGLKGDYIFHVLM